MNFNNLPPIEINSDEFFRSHHKLPPLPQIVTRIQEIMDDENINISDIAVLVSGDVALVAQILKIVNSAYYSLKSEITDLKIAIAFLGINEIYRIVLSLSVIKMIKPENNEDIKDFWYSSYYSALCVKLLASKYSRFLDREELWSASLLNDIGSLVYLKFFPDHYKAISATAKEKNILFSMAEEELNFPSSASFGSLLCTYWKLPQAIKMACENHTFEALKKISLNDHKADFKKIICLGSLCSDFTIRELNADLKSQIAQTVISVLDIDEHEFLLLMGEVRDIQHDVEGFMKSLF